MKCESCQLMEEDFDCCTCKIDVAVVDPDNKCHFHFIHRWMAWCLDVYGWL